MIFFSFSSTDEFWTDFATKLVSASTTLTSLELPKIAPKHLYAIAQSAHNSPITNITAINAYSVSCQDEALDLLQIVSNLENLQELKLKAASGGLSIDNFSTNLPEFVNLSSQNKLNKLVSFTFVIGLVPIFKIIFAFLGHAFTENAKPGRFTNVVPTEKSDRFRTWQL